MGSKKFYTVLVIGISILFSGCVPSLVYSPSINLPPKPLEKAEFQVFGGIGLLPETLPDKTLKKLALGGEMTVRYAFTNSYSMQLKGWHDYSNNVDAERWGISIASIIMLNNSGKIRYGLMPHLALAYGNSAIEGGGGSLPITVWINNLEPLSIYFGLGPIIGLRDISDDFNQWGWGLALNTGVGFLIKDRVTINLEGALIKQVNEYNGRKDYFFSPSLNIGYKF